MATLIIKVIQVMLIFINTEIIKNNNSFNKTVKDKRSSTEGYKEVNGFGIPP